MDIPIPVDNLNQSHEEARGQMTQIEIQDIDSSFVRNSKDISTLHESDIEDI